MDAAEIADHIVSRLEGVEVVRTEEDAFFFVGHAPADQRLPFATVVTSDAHDQASELGRAGVFRLNIGVSRETYEARFGAVPRGPLTAEPVDTGHDYAVLDVVMPHPIYASLGWVCVLNPSDATFEDVRVLLAEGYEIAAARRARREAES